MPAVQTTYNLYHDAYLEGQLYDTTSAVIVSRFVEGNAPIGFGRPLFQGVADRGVITGGTHVANDFIGISIQDIMGDPGLFLMQNGTPDGYRVGGGIKTLEIGTAVIRTTTAAKANQLVSVMADGTSFGATGQSMFIAATLVVAAAGTGYVVGDTVTVDGVAATVSAIGENGALTTLVMTSSPSAAADFAGTYPVVGGSGSGGTGTITTKQVSGMLTLPRVRFLASAAAGALVPVEIR